MVDILKGAKLNLIRYETVYWQVAGDREVEFDGEATSLNRELLYGELLHVHII